MTYQYATLREKIAAEKAERAVRYEQFAEWLKEAHSAGMVAGIGAEVEPMVVQQHMNMLDAASPVAKSYFVEGGVCGFAWITVRPANSSFALWAKKNSGDRWSKDYYGGLSLHVHEFGQSMQRKQAYAHAYVDVLCGHGIKAYAHSRMD